MITQMFFNIPSPYIKLIITEIIFMDTRSTPRILADKLQLSGLDVDKNAIQRIECGKRYE